MARWLVGAQAVAALSSVCKRWIRSGASQTTVQIIPAETVVGESSGLPRILDHHRCAIIACGLSLMLRVGGLADSIFRDNGYAAVNHRRFFWL